MVEWNSLENCRLGNGTVGSNPTPSAMYNGPNYFSSKEHQFQERFRVLRDRVFSRLVKVLVRCNITPNAVTLVSFLCVLVSAVFVASVPWVAITFLFLHVALDGVDGVLARYTGTSSKMGAYIDMCNDQLGFVIIAGALAWSGVLNPILSIVYVVTYLGLVILLVYSNAVGISPSFTFRSKYFFYIAYAAWALGAYSTQHFNDIVLIFTLVTIPFLLDVGIRTVTYWSKK